MYHKFTYVYIHLRITSSILHNRKHRLMVYEGIEKKESDNTIFLLNISKDKTYQNNLKTFKIICQTEKITSNGNFLRC